MMKKNTKRRNALSTTGQIRATRLNNLEHHRLEKHVNLMSDDLQIHLACLQRQAQEIRYHYTNVVRVILPNPAYQLWKQVHAYEIAQDEAKNWTGLDQNRLFFSSELIWLLLKNITVIFVFELRN
jgi:hypothetical protein